MNGHTQPELFDMNDAPAEDKANYDEYLRQLDAEFIARINEMHRATLGAFVDWMDGEIR